LRIMAGDAEPAAEKLRQGAAGLPEVTEGTFHGTPSFTVRKKFLARVKDADTVVLMCPIEEKEMLMEAAPDIYFETDHYRGWPAILARIHEIDPDELRHRLERAFAMQAPKGVVKAWQAGRGVGE
jgi:hypothetical protein